MKSISLRDAGGGKIVDVGFVTLVHRIVIATLLDSFYCAHMEFPNGSGGLDKNLTLDNCYVCLMFQISPYAIFWTFSL